MCACADRLAAGGKSQLSGGSKHFPATCAFAFHSMLPLCKVPVTSKSSPLKIIRRNRVLAPSQLRRSWPEIQSCIGGKPDLHLADGGVCATLGDGQQEVGKKERGGGLAGGEFLRNLTDMLPLMCTSALLGQHPVFLSEVSSGVPCRGGRNLIPTRWAWQWVAPLSPP